MQDAAIPQRLLGYLLAAGPWAKAADRGYAHGTAGDPAPDAHASRPHPRFQVETPPLRVGYQVGGKA